MKIKLPSNSFPLSLKKPFIKVLLIFTIIIASTTPSALAQTCNGIPDLECQALYALYNSTDGDNWTNNGGWLSTESVNSWFGATVEEGHVTEIRLENNSLTGPIPPELANLANLSQLGLRYNSLTGSIPPELGSLANLFQLGLYGNDLTGSIPPELGNLANLQELLLYDNNLTGSIPPELGNLANLIILYLDTNDLTGSIPPELGNLTSLQELHLTENSLTGSIPPELGNLANLSWVRIFRNSLTGSIPPELGNLTNLFSLDLSQNSLSGSIPPELGNLANLENLQLDVNSLSGSIPPELGNLANLQQIDLGYNSLTGSIPSELANLANIGSIYLRSNNLTGSIPPELGNMANLRGLDLQKNSLSGAIPPELGNLATLYGLRLNNNSLSGDLPPWLATPPSILDLSYNCLYASDAGVLAAMEAKHAGNFMSTQTPLPFKALGLSPSNGGTEQSIEAEVSWSNGGGAVTFDVYFGTAPAPGSGEFQGNQSGTNYDPGTLAYSTTYFWRIDAKNCAGTTTGDVWSFTTNAEPPPTHPFKTTTPNPSNGATEQSIETDVSWSDGGGAVTFDVYFGTTPAPGSGEFKGNQSGTSYDPGTLAYSTTYFWRIDAKNSVGTTTGDVWSFTTEAEPPPHKAINPNPSNGATEQSIETDVSWADGGSAVTFDVYFGTAPSPGIGEFQGNQSGTNFDPGTLAYSTTYYWKIDAKNPGGVTTGDVWSFTTEEEPPTKATGPSPSNSASEQSIESELSWADGGGSETFDVYFGTAPSPGSGDFQINTSATSFDPGTLAYSTTYYWRIDAKNSGGTTTGDVWSFTTEEEPLPIKSATPSPPNGAAEQSIETNISWVDGGGAETFDVYFGTAPSPGSGEFKGNQSGTSFDPGTLAYSTTYFWRIDAKNSVGTTTGDVWSFTTEEEPLDPPEKAISPSPPNSATDQSIDTGLSWTDGGGAETYDVYFGTDPTPGSPEFKINSANTNYDPGTLAYSTTYYWRIDAKNSAGTTTGDVWSFTTEDEPLEPPVKAVSPSPANGTTEQSIEANLSWVDGGGAETFDVYFGTAPSPGSGEFKGNQSGTSFDPGTLDYDTTYFWRIDSTNSDGTTTGDVWSFTTEKEPPEPPSGVNGQTGSGIGQIILSWNSVSGATGYKIYYEENESNPPYTPTKDGSPSSGSDVGNKTQVTISSLTPGIVYYCAIKAYNNSGESDYSEQASAMAESGESGIPESEYQVLESLYNSTGGDQWLNNTNWMSEEPAYSWFGLTVSGGHVIEIDLSRNNLTGHIPSDLGNLTNLRLLSLNDNSLTGGIPPELGALSSLEVLWLRSNKLSGDLPTFLASPPASTNLRWNCLYASNPSLLAVMEDRHSNSFMSTQTIPPGGVSASIIESSGYQENRALVSWNPISYINDDGGYQVYYRRAAPQGEVYASSEESGSDYFYYGITSGKEASSLTVSNLEPGVEYEFHVNTVTWAHANNRNDLYSPDSGTSSAVSGTYSRAFVPIWKQSPGYWTGVVASNFGDTGFNLDIAAYDSAGELEPLGQNPANSPIGAGLQNSLLGSEFLGTASQPDLSWIELGADGTNKMGSIFLFGVNDTQLMDGAESQSSYAKKLYFTRPLDEGFFDGWGPEIQMSIVNPTDEEVTVRCVLKGSNGEAESTFAIPSRGFISGDSEDLIGLNHGIINGYMEVEVTEGNGVMGFSRIEFPGVRTALGMNAVQTTASKTFYSAQLAHGMNIVTNLRLVNTSSSTRNVTLSAIGDDGTPVADPVTVAIPSKQIYSADLGTLFGLESEGVITTGSLVVDSDGNGIIGDIIFADGDTLKYAMSLPLQDRLFQEAVFNHISNLPTVFTGFAFYNPGEETATVLIEAIGTDGEKVAEKTLILDPGERIARTLTDPDIWPAFPIQSGGYIKIQSDQPIAGQQLFGDRALRYMAAIPPTTRIEPMFD